MTALNYGDESRDDRLVEGIETTDKVKHKSICELG